MKRKLAAPLNLRIATPRVCAFCRHYERMPRGDRWMCQRDGVPRRYGADQVAHARFTCDRYAPPGGDV